MLRRWTAATLLACALALGSAPLATAIDGVVIDGSEVTATEAEDGRLEAEVSFINTTAERVTLPAPEVTTASCPVSWKADSLAPLEAGSLTLILDPQCFAGDSDVASVVVDIDGDSGDRMITVKRPQDSGLDWSPLGWGLAFGLAAALAVLAWGAAAVRKGRETMAGSRTQREQEFVVFRTLLTGWLGAGSDRPFAVRDTLPADVPYGWSSTVDGLDAGWSFKDSWVSTASAGTAALVAFLTSTDAFTTLLGEAPKETLGVLTIAGLLTAIVLAVANLVVKMAGDDVSTVTVRGLVLSTALVAFATAFQIAALTSGVFSVVTGEVAQGMVLGTGVVVGVIVILYVLENLFHTVAKGVASQFPVIPADAQTAWAWKRSWQRALVAQSLMTEYEDWLRTPPPPTAEDGVEREPMREELVPLEWLTSQSRRRSAMP